MSIPHLDKDGEPLSRAAKIACAMRAETYRKGHLALRHADKVGWNAMRADVRDAWIEAVQREIDTYAEVV